MKRTLFALVLFCAPLGAYAAPPPTSPNVGTYPVTFGFDQSLYSSAGGYTPLQMDSSSHWLGVTVEGGSSGSPEPVTQAPITYAAPLALVSVSTSSTLILAAATYTKALTLCSTPTTVGNVWLNFAGAAAVSGTGIYIPANGGCVSVAPPTAAVYGISDSGTASVTGQGG